MLWKTHRRITERICVELGIQIESWEANRLIEGVLTPDNWKDYPHHHGRSQTIKYFLLESRKSFLKGEMPETYYSLGVALHYIQDAYTSFAWRSPDISKRQEWHTKYEQWIDEAYFENDLDKLVRRSFPRDPRQMENCLSILKLLSYRIDGKEETITLATCNSGKDSSWDSEWGKPVVDLNLAYQVSLAIVKSVLGSRIQPMVTENLEKVLRAYEEKLKETERYFSNKIRRSIQKRDNARNAKGSISFFRKIITARIYDIQSKRNIKKYKAREHLLKVSEEYNKTARNIALPYLDWYDVGIPSIDINNVEQLLPTDR